jgi:hypothetical protein
MPTYRTRRALSGSALLGIRMAAMLAVLLLAARESDKDVPAGRCLATSRLPGRLALVLSDFTRIQRRTDRHSTVTTPSRRQYRSTLREYHRVTLMKSSTPLHDEGCHRESGEPGFRTGAPVSSSRPVRSGRPVACSSMLHTGSTTKPAIN